MEPVVPGGEFVVGGAMAEAAVEDADPAVPQLAKCLLIALATGPKGVIVDASAG
jgi:hypothetical protein